MLLLEIARLCMALTWAVSDAYMQVRNVTCDVCCSNHTENGRSTTMSPGTVSALKIDEQDESFNEDALCVMHQIANHMRENTWVAVRSCQKEDS